MKIVRLTFSMILLFLAFSSQAQRKLERINSGEIIKEVIKLEDDEKYQEAASLCEKVGRNDTNYVRIHYGEAYSFYNLGKYDTVIRICNELTGIDDYIGTDAYILMGNSYDAKKKPEEAIKVYKAALLKFPMAYLLHFNLGVAYYKSGKMDDAYKSFKKVLDLNPFYPTAHYFLGLINAEEKRWTPAMLAMHTCLILGPNKNVETRCRNMLTNIAKGDYVPDSTAHVFSEPEDPTFVKIDKLIDSKMAFRTDYVIVTKMDDKLMKQTQLLLETLMQSKPKSDNYFVKLYLPLYSGIMDHKFLKTFLYYPYHNLDNEIITKWKAKSKKEIKEFEDWESVYFTNLSAEYADTADGKPYTFKRYFYSNHNIELLGDYADAKKEIPKGYWKVFYDNTVLAAQGDYDEHGKKKGPWKGYYESGKIRTETVYKGGKLNGPYKEYYKNGNTYMDANYKDGIYDGTVKEYFKNGALKSDETYVAGAVNGHAKYYYENGNIKGEGDFKNGNMDGKVIVYDGTGTKTLEVDTKAGKQDGVLVEYHPNGTIKTKGNMSADHLTGKFQYYNTDGKLIKEGEFQEGKMEGVWKEYHGNGKLSQELGYVKGKAQGIQTQYDEDGVKYFEGTFKDDKLVGYKYLDKAGKVLSEGTETHGEMPFKGYHPDGTLSLEGTIKKGLRDGKWTFYYKNGGVKTVENYDNGTESGPYKSFYKNGAVNIEGTFKDGSWDGMYRKYFQNGKLETEELVVNGKAEEDAYTYLSNGALLSHYYYRNGDEYKWQSFYFPDGKLDYEYYMDLAHMSKYYIYDTSGQAVSRFDNPTGTAACDVKFFNGKQLLLTTYDRGRIEGENKRFYGNGQLDAVSHYHRGIETGSYTRNFTNGKIAISGSYLLGKRDGIWTYYNDKGYKESSGLNKEGDYTGIWNWYYDNGKTESIAKYVEDVKDSFSVYYAPDGTVRMKFRYDNGVLMGYTYVGKDGKDVPEIPLPHETGSIVAYYPNGNKSYEGAYKKGSRDGKVTYYYPDGKVQWVFNYKDGWAEGTQLYYYPDGKVEKVQEEMNDDLHGLTKYYDKGGVLKKEQNYYMGYLHGLSKVYEGSNVKVSNYYYGVLLSEK